MSNYVSDHLKEIVVIALLILIGAFLLIDPGVFATAMIRVAGMLLTLLGVVRVLRYFRTNAVEAAGGTDLFTGCMAVCFGLFCLFGAQVLKEVFPMLARFYGLMCIVLGFRKAQKAVDALRLGLGKWYLPAASALISLVFGLIIALVPGVTWVFTGLAMIIEGIYDAVCLWLSKDRSDRYVVVPLDRR